MFVKRLSSSLVAVLLLLVLGGWGGKDKVYTWQDRARTFDSFQAFDWLPPQSLRGIERSPDADTIDGWILKVMEAELSELGLRRDREGDVDFLIAYTYRPPERSTRGSGYPSHPRGGCGRGAIRAGGSIRGIAGQRIDNSLYVELQDPATRMPIWRGRVRPVLRKNEPLEESIVRAVRSILDRYPAAASADES